MAFVTLTLPHGFGDRLGPLFSGVSESWSSVMVDKSVRKFRERFPFGFVRSVEVTDGENGWHPHAHAVVLFDERLDRAALIEFRDVVFRAWCSAVERRGWRSPSPRYGIEVRQCSAPEAADRLGEYLTKQVDGLGQELTRLDSKRARSGNSPFQLLCLAASGDAGACARWWEYEGATFGRRAMTWSRGARAGLALGAEESDEAMLDEGWRDATDVGSLGAMDADLLVLHPNGYEVLCEVLADDPSVEGLRFAIDAIYRSLPMELLPAWHPYRDLVLGRRLEMDAEDLDAREALFVGQQAALFELEPF
jgi:hypothetical protein